MVDVDRVDVGTIEDIEEVMIALNENQGVQV